MWYVTGTMADKLALGPYTVGRIGFGAMQLPGPGVFGPPRDRGEAIAVLRRAVELGVDHVDTSQYYGPDVANELIHEALHPYPDDLVIVSKVGARRDETGGWHEYNKPDELRAGVESNLRALDVERVHAVNLRVMGGEPDALFDDQLNEMVAMRDEGLIGAAGVSNVSLAQFEHAVERTDIACVQNSFNIVERSSEPILRACEERGIAFVPFFPLGSGFPGMNKVLDHEGVVATASRLGATPAQVALAWLLAFSGQIALIPGTSSRVHLEENMGAGSIKLDADALG
jgi:aryl-alcohol dehydrogenase-like predicted oxidoreductase